MASGSKPSVCELLERIAGVMDLDSGRYRLELIYEDGRLREWYAHAERRPASALRVYDDRARLITPAGDAS